MLDAPAALATVGPAVSTPLVMAPVTAAHHVTLLDILDFNVMKGVTGTFTQDLFQPVVCKEIMYQVYI